MRISLARVLVALAAITAVVFGGIHLGQAAVAETRVPGNTAFAAYVDVTAVPIEHFEVPSGPTHNSAILAFIVADKTDPCAPSWGTYYSMPEADANIDLSRRIAQLRATGGDIRVSFGGAINSELSSVCTDATKLAAAYASVVDYYKLTSIDLDLEGPALGSAATSARRAAAIKSLQVSAAKAGTPLRVWLTLPSSTQGLTDQGFAEVQTMLDAGVDLAGVNAMTMDFGPSKDDSASMASTVQTAAEQVHRQLGVAYDASSRSLDPTALWNKVGITPMIGQNDTPNEQFTITDATKVNAFALAHGVGMLSMWSLNRDSSCTLPTPVITTVVQDDCSGVDQGGASFQAVLSAGTKDSQFAAPKTPSPAASVARILPDDPAKSPFPIWDADCDFPAGTRIVWHHNVYKAKWWNHGTAPDSPVVHEEDSPWRLIGPVLPGDHPAPLPTVPAGTYPTWSATAIYNNGARVQIDNIPYQAKWWTQGDKPGTAFGGASPWTMVLPTVTDLG
jgi:chitinase